jgi:DNA-directed RNA polymerase alpha subunit
MGALTEMDPNEVLSGLAFLVGKTVTEVRYMEPEEVTHLEKEFGFRFCGRPLVVMFDQPVGWYIFPGVNGSLMVGCAPVSKVNELPPADSILSQSVDVLNLSTRPATGLKNGRIYTIEQLCSTGEGDLLKIKNFGRKSLNEVKAALAERGLTLKGYRTWMPSQSMRGWQGSAPTRVDDLELTVRTSLGLCQARIKYVWQLIEHTEEDLMHMKKPDGSALFGRKSRNEIREVLEEWGFALKGGRR